MDSNISTNYSKALADLGLTKVQSLLYLTSLKHGLLSVLELSRLTKISRQQIYEDAEKLVEIGLYDITRKQRRKYIPADPNRLVRLAKDKINKTEETLSTLTSILPSLEALSVANTTDTLIKHYEGVKGLKKAYQEELEQAKRTEVLSFAGSIDDIYQFFPETYWEKWNRQLIKQGSRSRMLVHTSQMASEAAKHDIVYHRTTRHLADLPLKVNIDICNDTVFIISFYDKLAISIKSSIIAEAHRMIFETTWQLAQPFE